MPCWCDPGDYCYVLDFILCRRLNSIKEKYPVPMRESKIPKTYWDFGTCICNLMHDPRGQSPLS